MDNILRHDILWAQGHADLFTYHLQLLSHGHGVAEQRPARNAENIYYLAPESSLIPGVER